MTEGESPPVPAERSLLQWVADARRPLALGLLFFVLFIPQIIFLASAVWEEEKYSHGWLIPLVCAWWLWAHREENARVPRRPSSLGLVPVVLGVAIWVVYQARHFNAAAHLAMMLVLVGMVLYASGWRYLRAVAFPVLYLGFAFPVPKRFDELHIALPLQRVASVISAKLIDAVGIPVFREGNVIQIPHVKLCVEEACSGIRSLYSLIALGTFYVFFFEKRTWEKIVLIASTVPIAVLANVIRISGTGMLVHWVSPAMAKGKIHEYAGVLVFLIGLSLLLVEAALLRFFFPPAEVVAESENAPE